MPNVPVTGITATIGSITAGTDLLHIQNVACDLVAFVPSVVADSFDTTRLAAATRRMTAGLASADIPFRALYPLTTPRVGASGLVTFASGTTAFCNSFSMTFDWGEVDITRFTGAAQTHKVFRPGTIPTISGSFRAYVLDDATPLGPTAPNGNGAAVSFKLTEDGAIDPAIAGNIIVTGEQYGEVSRTTNEIPVTYQFQGAGTALWTSTAGTSTPCVLPAGNIDAPDWDTNNDGVPDVSATFTFATSRTFVSSVFIRTLTIESTAQGLILVSGVLRTTGAITRA